MTPLGRLLQNVDAGFGGISSQPLALATNFSAGLELDHHLGPDVEKREIDNFLALAQIVEVAHRRTVSWVRSRLPGYPLIGVPQLAPGSALTSDEFTFRYTWSRADLRSGLQYSDFVPELERLLGASADLDLRTLVTDLVEALSETREWQEFATRREALTPHDKEALSRARADLKERVSAERVDAHEPRRALRRDDFRMHHTLGVVDELPGPPGDFARSFQALNDLIDLTLVQVFAQFVRFGGPHDVEAKDLEFGSTDDGKVTIDVDDELVALALKPGRIVRVNHVLIDDLVRIESTGFSFMGDRSRCRLTGSLLPATSRLFTD